MDFEKFSKETAGKINQQIKKLLGEWRNEVGETSSTLLPLVDKFIKASEGGKRIRGVLVVLGYWLAQSVILSSSLKNEGYNFSYILRSPRRLQNDKKMSRENVYKVAAAYEICHSAILVHDDIIDQSPLRRGQPSLYQALGSNHYGVSQAISLGDAGFFLAIRIISKTIFDGRQKMKALQWFSQTMLDTATGEMLDVEKGDVVTIMKLKTAKYSVSGPLILGAILGGASEQLLKNLAEFGENLGIVYQIQDDILGVFGSAEQIGKSVASDIEEGKNTLLYNYALKGANPEQRQVLGKYYGKRSAGKQGLQQVREIFKSTGALDKAKKAAGEYKSRALKGLPKITKDKQMSKLFIQMAEYLVQRTK